MNVFYDDIGSYSINLENLVGKVIYCASTEDEEVQDYIDNFGEIKMLVTEQDDDYLYGDILSSNEEFEYHLEVKDICYIDRPRLLTVHSKYMRTYDRIVIDNIDALILLLAQQPEYEFKIEYKLLNPELNYYDIEGNLLEEF